MTLKHIILTVIFSFFSQTVLAIQVEDLKAYLKDLKTFEADFTQTLLDRQGNTIEKSSGKMYLNNPGQFHWAYQEPFLQQVITDNVSLWIYDEDLEQVTIKSVEGNLDNTPAAVLSGKEDIDTHFNVEDLSKIEGLRVYQLSPKDEDGEFHSIRIGFHAMNLTLLWLVDNLGQITRIDFSQQKLNKPLSDELFHFEPPEGTDVIDTRANSESE